MVVSNINSNVSYPERKTIDEDDKGQDVSMFQIKLFEIGKRRILIESGLTFLNQLLKFGLINNLYLFKTNKPDPFICNFKALFTSSISIYFTLSRVYNWYVLRPRAYLINIINCSNSNHHNLDFVLIWILSFIN